MNKKLVPEPTVYTMAKKKPEPFNLLTFTTQTFKNMMYVCVVPVTIILLPLIAATGVWLFVSSLVKGMQENK